MLLSSSKNRNDFGYGFAFLRKEAEPVHVFPDILGFSNAVRHEIPRTKGRFALPTCELSGCSRFVEWVKVDGGTAQ
jgi:hypothetical protein